MSREERRRNARLMKGMDRTPGLPPAARARAERMRARREAARASGAATAFTLGWWVRAILIATLAGLLGLSLQWPQMPWAMYVGVVTAAAVLVLQVGFRLLRRRAARA